MRLIKVTGGLGNQIFIYAFYLRMKKAFRFFKTILERKQTPCTEWAFAMDYLWPLVYFKGFYQSERYSADIQEEVRKALEYEQIYPKDWVKIATD